MATVTALSEEDGRPVAIVQGPDGVEYPIWPQGGWLPAVGDTVTLVANGADPIASIARRLVEGTVESGDGYDIFAEHGWGMTETGDWYANNAYIRGLIEASTINASTINGGEINGGDIVGATVTAPLIRSAISGPRLMLTDDGEILMHTGSSGETSPGLIAFTPGAVFVRSPGRTGSPRQSFVEAGHNGALSYARVTGEAISIDTIGELGLEGDTVAIGGNSVAIGGRVDVDSPLLVCRRTSTQAIGNATWTALAPDSVLAQRKIAIDGLTRFRPTEPGWYEIDATVTWPPGAGSFVGGAGVGIQGSTAAGLNFTPGSFGSQNTGFVGVTSKASGVWWCNGTTNYLEARAFSAGSTDAQLLRCTVKRLRGAI